MSTTKGTNRTKILSLILVITTVAGAGGSFYYYNLWKNESSSNVNLTASLTNARNADSNANSTIASLTSTISDLNARITSLDSQITSLNTLKANYTAWVQILTGQLGGNVTQNALLKAEITTLEEEITTQTQMITGLTQQLVAAQIKLSTSLSELSQFTAVHFSAQVAASSVSASCGLFCSNFDNKIDLYIAVNMGNVTANSVQLTVLFYDQAGQTGAVNCQLTLSLGNIPGQDPSMNIQDSNLVQGSHDCGRSSAQSLSFSSQLSWK